MRVQAANALICLAEIRDRSGSEQVVGCDVWTRREYLPPLADDEFYWHDTIGKVARTDDGQEIGTVTSLMATGAHDILVVRSRQGKEYLIPALRQFWVGIDAETGALIVAPAPGLLEIND